MKLEDYTKTALILVDPFNDFLSEGGKMYPYTKETVEGIQLVQNLKKLIAGARERNIQIIYAPHRNTQKGDYMNWRFLSPSHQGSKATVLFEKGKTKEALIQLENGLTESVSKVKIFTQLNPDYIKRSAVSELIAKYKKK